MLRHIVLLQVSGDVAPLLVATIFDELSVVALETPGMLAFSGGVKTVGSGMSQGFTHAITIDFIDEAARDAYLAGLDKDGIGQRITEVTVSGLGGILVMNFDISNTISPRDTSAGRL